MNSDKVLNGAVSQENPGIEEREELVPVDASVIIHLNNDKLSAEAEITPPSNGGREAGPGDVSKALEEAGVVFGVDNSAVAFLEKPSYSQRVRIAQALLAVNGTDGSYNELFERERKRTYAVRADGTINYKELNFIHDIEEGTVICEIVKETKGVNGTDVCGKVLKAIDGKAPPLLVGDGARLSEDGLRIEAAVQGNLVFNRDRFSVEKAVRVKKVDLDTGNIRFSGDVHVAEDVYDGFEISSGGNIHLNGYVGACKITAKGDIIISKGINGTGRAVIEAGGSISAGFIEHSTIIAGGKITAKTIINSDVSCESDIDVTQGKGIISGGQVTCYGNVKANVVGNENSAQTYFTLGITSRMLAERDRIAKDIATLTKNIDDMLKNVEYINGLLENKKPVPPERLGLLQKTKLSLPISQKRLEKLRADLVIMDNKLNATPTSFLSARMIFPPTILKIGSQKFRVSAVLNSSRIYCNSEGEIVTGAK